jgi:large subunit ribosomal protein L4
MASVKVYNDDGKVVEEIEIELDETLARRGDEVLAQSLLRQAANTRKPYAHVKTRAEVSGGGAKPWRQKGVGRARHGSRRSPIFTGGGRAFGPTRERNFTKSMNKKERRLAMQKALYLAITGDKVSLVQGISYKEPSTKRGVKLFNDIGLEGKVLFVHDYDEKAIVKTFANIPKLTTYNASRVNAFDLLAFDKILLVRDEFEKIRERWLD